jgi:hypothetical protein
MKTQLAKYLNDKVLYSDWFTSFVTVHTRYVFVAFYEHVCDAALHYLRDVLPRKMVEDF